MSLLPAPLSIVKNRNTGTEDRPKRHDMDLQQQEERSESRFSSSSDSYVVYTGVRESVRAYVRHKMQKRRDNPKKERERVMSVASAKYPGMLTAQQHDRKHSSVSRKNSVQQGFSSVYDKISRRSISGLSVQSKEEKDRPRGRQKQLAIPTSAYQKYGVAVWEAPKRQKKTNRASAPAKTLTRKDDNGHVRRRPSLSVKPGEVVSAFKNGRSHIIHVLDDTKHRLRRSSSEKRREALRQSIKIVGAADHVSDGRMDYPN